MTTFAVFGMSENWAREEARENTAPTKQLMGSGSNGQFVNGKRR